MELKAVIKKIVRDSGTETECLVLKDDGQFIRVRMPHQKQVAVNRTVFFSGVLKEDSAGAYFEAEGVGVSRGAAMRQLTVDGTVSEVTFSIGDGSRLILTDRAGARYAVSGYGFPEGIAAGDRIRVIGNEYGLADGEHLFWADGVSFQAAGRAVRLPGMDEGADASVEGEVVAILSKEDDGTVDAMIGTPRGRVEITGVIPELAEGMVVSVKGTYGPRNRRGVPVVVGSYRLLDENRRREVTAYLMKNVGGMRLLDAVRYHERFGDGAVAHLTRHPNDAFLVPGLDVAVMRAARSHFAREAEIEKVKESLSPLGMDGEAARRAYEAMGESVLKAVKDPYLLIGAVPGVGFAEADGMALRSGYPKDGRARVEAAVRDVLSSAARTGSNCSVEASLTGTLAERLEVPGETVAEAVGRMASGPGRSLRRSGGMVYLAELYKAERRVAEGLLELSGSRIAGKGVVDDPATVRRVEMSLSIIPGRPVLLDETQREAVRNAVRHPVSVISGDADAERKTASSAAAQFLRNAGMKVAHVAATESEAIRFAGSGFGRIVTVSGLLERSGEGFARNAGNPLGYDAVVVEGAHALDALMAEALLSALPKGTRLVLAGDPYGLPDQGAGSVFQGVVSSGVVPVTRMDGRQGRHTTADDLRRTISDILSRRTSLLAERLRGEIEDNQRIRSRNGERKVKPRRRKDPATASDAQPSEAAARQEEAAPLEEPRETQGRATSRTRFTRPGKEAATAYVFEGRNVQRKPSDILPPEMLSALLADGFLGRPFQMDGKMYVVTACHTDGGHVLMENTKDVLDRLRGAEGVGFMESFDLARGAAVDRDGRKVRYDVFAGSVIKCGGRAVETVRDVAAVREDLRGRRDVRVISLDDFIKTAGSSGADVRTITSSLELTGRMEGCVQVGGKTYIAELHPERADVVLMMDSWCGTLSASITAIERKEADNLRFGQGFYDRKERCHKAYSIYRGAVAPCHDYGEELRNVLARNEKDDFEKRISSRIDQALKEGNIRRLSAK